MWFLVIFSDFYDVKFFIIFWFMIFSDFYGGKFFIYFHFVIFKDFYGVKFFILLWIVQNGLFLMRLFLLKFSRKLLKMDIQGNEVSFFPCGLKECAGSLHYTLLAFVVYAKILNEPHKVWSIPEWISLWKRLLRSSIKFLPKLLLKFENA